jgi:Ca-activated chloride channel family protein
MSIVAWLRSPRIRRGLAASAVVLAAGGLVLFRAPASAHGPEAPHVPFAPSGAGIAAFHGPGAHGQLALSQTKVLTGATQTFFAEVRLTADATEEAHARAPLSIAVVLDTSGSMDGEKIDQAKKSVIQTIRDMRDDDEIALVRYASDSELLQPLVRVGSVREALVSRVRAIQAGGGTNIPGGLAVGLRALEASGKGRVRRVVLVSDGLDSTRADAERMARDAFERGVTLSSMGIGLDFDESYMGGVAHAGHGNFGFVKDAAALATFLRRELTETAATTVENATVRVKLPAGVRFVRATGADARLVNDGTDLELKMGSLFAGDERRAILELSASLGAGDVRGIEGFAAWDRVGGAAAEVRIPRLELVASADATEVDRARDGTVLASATSALASQRELEATEAYARGDNDTAQRLIDQNIAALTTAAAAAPAPAATSLAKQRAAYQAHKAGFGSSAPDSLEGKAAAKRATEKELSNTDRSVAY